MNSKKKASKQLIKTLEALQQKKQSIKNNINEIIGKFNSGNRYQIIVKANKIVDKCFLAIETKKNGSKLRQFPCTTKSDLMAIACILVVMGNGDSNHLVKKEELLITYNPESILKINSLIDRIESSPTIECFDSSMPRISEINRIASNFSAICHHISVPTDLIEPLAKRFKFVDEKVLLNGKNINYVIGSSIIHSQICRDFHFSFTLTDKQIQQLCEKLQITEEKLIKCSKELSFRCCQIKKKLEEEEEEEEEEEPKRKKKKCNPPSRIKSPKTENL
jgi:hypothetical protein